MTEKKKLVILTGPTAVGKTKLSIELAKRIGGEIISADSMQVYKYMDIGSAKIMPQEMDGVVHHLIDVLNPTEDFDVYRFLQMAKVKMQEIYERGHIPVIVGGTGFYIQAVLYDIDFTQSQEDSDLRIQLEELAKTQGAHVLHEMLREVDPQAAEEIHENNVKRVIRAIEYFRQTGEKISEHNKEQRAKESPYNFCYFVLNDDRAKLYERIDQRVDLMLEAGLVEEVKQLQAMGCRRESTAMQGLGYKEIIDYLQGEIDLERAIYLIKRDTRHFAKRQITWFKREKEVVWVPRQQLGPEDEKLLAYMLSELKKRKISEEEK
ncbi:MAG: tRNA (adenosine(37)-N6)-dimethylallyltransferase MiaA [Lachnospiraceae bacterium]|nr:tRNA (adenosine(37)-N6)-dimethylallyltransferase MiaA [Lachnospiraceae bacterium]